MRKYIVFFIMGIGVFCTLSAQNNFQVEPLLGVNLSGGEFGNSVRFPSEDDIEYFHQKGMKLIRFPFKWERVQRTLYGDLEEKDITEMKAFVQAAADRGMWVMLDMHNFCRLQARDHNGFYNDFVIGETDVVTADHLADVWRKLALEFKEFDNLWGYDLMNEPHHMPSPTLWGEVAQVVINAIREVDKNTPIVIEGENYAAAYSWPDNSDYLKNLVDESNKLIFQAHTYFDRDGSGVYVNDGTYDPVIPSDIWKIRLEPFVKWCHTNGVHGVIGELGVPSRGKVGEEPDTRWMEIFDNALQYLSDNGLSFTYWSAGNWPDTYILSLQPLENYMVDRPQMQYMEKHAKTWGANYDPAGIDHIIREEVKVFPVPVKDILTISSAWEMQSVSFYDTTARLIKQETLESMENNIDVSSLPVGTYIIKILLKDGRALNKSCIKL